VAYVVTAKWTAKEGEQDRVLAAIKNMIAPSRDEPGCVLYQPHRDPESPLIFFFYEQYVDQEAYAAHAASKHFQDHALGEAIPLLASRERSFFEILDA